MESYDVVVIGGGVIGCAIARVLSRYDLRLALLEGKEDVAMGASKANSAIVHAGYDCKPGSLMAELNVKGNALYTSWCEDLEVPLKRCGSLVIGFNDQDKAEIQKLYDFGQQNGVPDLSLIDGDAARILEPALNEKVTCALFAPTGGITCPFELTIACAENARDNGCVWKMNHQVTAIEKQEDGFVIKTSQGSLFTGRIINAAGVFADDIARMIGDDYFSIEARRGEYMLLDRTAGDFVKTVIFQTPSDMGKGVLVSPTVHGNVFAGPTAADQKEKEDTQTTQEGMDELLRMSLRSVPTLPLRSVITSFTGLRAVGSTGDFIMEASHSAPRCLHVAGICSPGLSSAPAIAEKVVELLVAQGVALTQKADYIKERKHILALRAQPWENRSQLIAKNPAYARVVCRCETVTEAEIVEAIARGARSLDAIKRRTRAGFGRCQGGFCSPVVMQILCRELGVSMEEITKFGGNSYVVAGKVKEVQA